MRVPRIMFLATTCVGSLMKTVFSGGLLNAVTSGAWIVEQFDKKGTYVPRLTENTTGLGHEKR